MSKELTRSEILRKRAEYAQAMSKEEIAKRQEDAAAGARNAWSYIYLGDANGLTNAWGMAPSVEPPPPPPTRMQRFKQWLSKVMP